MKKALILLILVFLNCYSKSQDLEYAKLIITKLTSSEFKGRGYTNEGNLKAAEYILSEYKQLGLLPVKNSYYQKFKISINTFPNELTLKMNNNILKPAVDYLVESMSPSIKGKYEVTRTSRKEINTQDKLIILIKKAGSDFILIDNTDKSNESKEETKLIEDYINFLKYSPQITI